MLDAERHFIPPSDRLADIGGVTGGAPGAKSSVHLLAIPVPLLAIGLWIPTDWSTHDPRLSSFYPYECPQRTDSFDVG
jgi:hypothetical protein